MVAYIKAIFLYYKTIKGSMMTLKMKYSVAGILVFFLVSLFDRTNLKRKQFLEHLWNQREWTWSHSWKFTCLQKLPGDPWSKGNSTLLSYLKLRQYIKYLNMLISQKILIFQFQNHQKRSVRYSCFWMKRNQMFLSEYKTKLFLLTNKSWFKNLNILPIFSKVFLLLNLILKT